MSELSSRSLAISSWKADIRAGFLVSLIAMPLSIGIAVASGAPASSGLIAAIIGGLLGSAFGGCRLAINGPAAGLIVTVAAAISELGAGDPLQGYQAMLGCLVVAGGLQVLLGLLRLATLGLAFPKPVVHGMLAAIGLIIVAKQSHVLFGATQVTGGPISLLAQIPSTISQLNPAVSLVGLLSLAMMIGWSFTPVRVQSKLPAALMTAAVGALLALLSGTGLANEHYLVLPKSLWDAVTLPSFAQINSIIFWKHCIFITLIASAESVLSACAVDQLDSENAPRSDLNRDLLGKGLINVVCGCVGGLPVITEIVRSSANVNNGAQSQRANFFHAAFLVTFLIVSPELLRYEPLAALAAVLIVTGYQLAAPQRFVAAFAHSWQRGAVFCSTIVAILLTDLLTGVLIGCLVHGLCCKLFSQDTDYQSL